MKTLLKRTALAAMATFLDLNGYDFGATQEDRFQWMLELSRGLDPEELAERLRPTLVELADDAPVDPTRGHPRRRPKPRGHE